jgi:HEAT repeat protein
LPLLLELAPADWHRKHEDVVSMLGKLRAPESVDALYLATQWVPEYLNYDESRALARKAVWALGGITTPQAEDALTRLLDKRDKDLDKAAAEQLRRRGRDKSKN